MTPATRSGEPAYLSAPPRLTQSMVNLDRRIKQRSDFRRLADDARAAGQLNLLLGGACACFLVVLFLGVVACLCALVPA